MSNQSSEGPVTFRRFITTRDGRRLDAREYGLKAWPIRGSSKGSKRRKKN